MDSLYIFLILIAGIVLILVFFLRSKWVVKINYQFPEMDNMQISVFFYNWCVLKQKKLRISSQKEMEKGYIHFYKLLREKKLHLLKELRFQALLKEIKVLELTWSTKGGTGNAFSTSITSGTIWAMKGWLIGYLTQQLDFCKNPQIHVQPDFQNSSLQTRFSCMISFRLGKTILGIMRVLKIKEVKK
ncbi:DUF2953 domain-containing protein [Oceanobacillus jeddahense]|uniref:DUF2953 domain-containing protein n=1 Tax=Oceanobacillus jeddahense TaxID=1462527 RepID=UPI00059637A1|nr:DUF2953 domain-containing protein [Oceanobacillus jeddahense]